MALDKDAYEAKLKAGIEKIEREAEDARCKNPKDRHWYAQEMAKLFADTTDEYVRGLQMEIGSLVVSGGYTNTTGGKAV